jgi:hypothetical protein
MTVCSATSVHSISVEHGAFRSPMNQLQIRLWIRNCQGIISNHRVDKCSYRYLQIFLYFIATYGYSDILIATYRQSYITIIATHRYCVCLYIVTYRYSYILIATEINTFHNHLQIVVCFYCYRQMLMFL